jgi:hypothetical protein
MAFRMFGTHVTFNRVCAGMTIWLDTMNQIASRLPKHEDCPDYFNRREHGLLMMLPNLIGGDIFLVRRRKIFAHKFIGQGLEQGR